jgi:hypothetical protein
MKKNENDSFVVFDNTKAGLLYDDSSHSEYPIRYYNIITPNNGEIGLKSNPDSSYYGYIYDGFINIEMAGRPLFSLSDGMFFSSEGGFKFSGCGKAVVIEVLHNKGIYPKNNYKAYYTIGGPIEKKGRLKYIDGCSDTLLISPVKLGDPCFNHLHFPPEIDQTQHTHPSHRIGIVANGYGECVTPFGNLPLKKGTIFIIKEWDGTSFGKGEDGETYPVGQHAFRTFESVMNVIAFHPDSDYGPTDELHPMINRTIVDGVSANKIDNIRTKIIK